MTRRRGRSAHQARRPGAAPRRPRRIIRAPKPEVARRRPVVAPVRLRSKTAPGDRTGSKTPTPPAYARSTPPHTSTPGRASSSPRCCPSPSYEDVIRPARSPPPARPTGAKNCAPRLELAADQFIVKRLHNKRFVSTILAGYPWFADWGRDTMISLPGLMLATKRFSRSPLRARSLRPAGAPAACCPTCSAITPTTPPTTPSTPACGTSTPCASTRCASGDHDIAPLLGACRRIVAGYCAGADFGIELCEDGLDHLRRRRASRHLDGRPARRRSPSPPATARPSRSTPSGTTRCSASPSLSANKKPRSLNSSTSPAAAGESFRSTSSGGPSANCLHDVLLRDQRLESPDGKLRPNQLFAVSLPFAPLAGETRE